MLQSAGLLLEDMIYLLVLASRIWENPACLRGQYTCRLAD